MCPHSFGQQFRFCLPSITRLLTGGSWCWSPTLNVWTSSDRLWVYFLKVQDSCGHSNRLIMNLLCLPAVFAAAGRAPAWQIQDRLNETELVSVPVCLLKMFSWCKHPLLLFCVVLFLFPLLGVRGFVGNWTRPAPSRGHLSLLKSLSKCSLSVSLTAARPVKQTFTLTASFCSGFSFLRF